MEGSETIFDRVRASARFVRDNAQDVKINHDAVAAFVKTLDPGSRSLLPSRVGVHEDVDLSANRSRVREQGSLAGLPASLCHA
jgi:hypothetical protein